MYEVRPSIISGPCAAGCVPYRAGRTRERVERGPRTTLTMTVGHHGILYRRRQPIQQTPIENSYMLDRRIQIIQERLVDCRFLFRNSSKKETAAVSRVKPLMHRNSPHISANTPNSANIDTLVCIATYFGHILHGKKRERTDASALTAMVKVA